MSVLVETSLGDITIDLFIKDCPNACKNFLKLCKKKYYNNSILGRIEKEFLVEIKLKHKNCIYENYPNEKNNKLYFDDELINNFKINKKGLICTANKEKNKNNSGFFITLSDNRLLPLEGKHTVFGQIVEGLDILDKINLLHLDNNNFSLVNILILHTYIIEDNFSDDFQEYESPNISIYENDKLDIDNDFNLIFQSDDENKNKENKELLKKKIQKYKDKSNAIILELLEDIPDSDIKPPDNILFVCKLNIITDEEDLITIFSKYGYIKSCEIIRDWKTGKSLQYGFIEFETKKGCEDAYFNLENTIIDDRKIHIDFSQSVSKIWMNHNLKKKNNKKNILKLKNNIEYESNTKDLI